MSVNNPNLMIKIKDIEERLSRIEMRLETLERIVRGPPVGPGPSPIPPGPGRGPEPLRF